ncbi:LOW QUALITY PROTEIN: hypothetical protein TorRG33x02_344890, partial [Trema orientale]
QYLLVVRRRSIRQKTVRSRFLCHAPAAPMAEQPRLATFRKGWSRRASTSAGQSSGHQSL